MPPPDALIRLIAAENEVPAPPPVMAIADAARERHGRGIVAVLFYGSCLRDRDDAGRIVDLYLLAGSYAQVHRNPLMRLLNRLLPPNVYYIETPFAGRTVRAKYTIMTLDQLERLVGRGTLQSYFWARFAQPTAVLWTEGATVRARITTALASAVLTTALETRPLLQGDLSPEALWSRGFIEAYRTELRAESPERGAMLYRSFPERYQQITNVILEGAGPPVPPGVRRRAEHRWWRRRVLGKTLSVLRLIKSAFTFEDGAAYVAWKIERHSGVKVALTPWQRRHPILASSTLFWRLYRAGGFR